MPLNCFAYSMTRVKPEKPWACNSNELFKAPDISVTFSVLCPAAQDSRLQESPFPSGKSLGGSSKL